MPMALSFRERALRRMLLTTLSLPTQATRAIGGPPARNDRGDLLDEETRILCALNALNEVDKERQTPEDARDANRRAIQIVQGAARMLRRTEDLVVEGVRVRLYVPDARGPLPMLVYLHGGGWVVGSIDTHDHFCRRIAADTGAIVASVDYPLAPEHPYPSGLRAATAAFRALRALAPSLGADPARVAVGGDSAGGNIAAALCLSLRDEGQPQPALQVLIYPGLDLRCLSASFASLGRGYILTQSSIRWYIRLYGAREEDPRASVLLEPDLSGLAPAFIVTAGFDPLRDDGELYAKRLLDAGVRAAHRGYGSLIHGFINMDGAIGEADRALEDITLQLRDSWSAG